MVEWAKRLGAMLTYVTRLLPVEDLFRPCVVITLPERVSGLFKTRINCKSLSVGMSIFEPQSAGEPYTFALSLVYSLYHSANLTLFPGIVFLFRMS